MLTLTTSPELEDRLEEEAAKWGLSAADYAVRLIEEVLREAVLRPADRLAGPERLTAIDELMGAAAESSFSSADLRHERDAERDREEDRQKQRFG